MLNIIRKQEMLHEANINFDGTLYHTIYGVLEDGTYYIDEVNDIPRVGLSKFWIRLLIDILMGYHSENSEVHYIK